MIKTVLRALVGVVGALALVLALRLWIDPAAAAANLGLMGRGALGLASLRADVGGFFAVAGLLSLLGAVRMDGRLLTAPALLAGLAITGRLITVVQAGLTPDQVMPIVVEAVLVVVLVAGRRAFGVR